MPNRKEKLILIGGGGHCKSCIDVIEQTDQYEIDGILDKTELVGQKVLGYEIIGTDKKIEKLATEGFCFLITVGQIRSSAIRVTLFDKLMECNAKIATIISPRAYVSKHARVGVGTIVMHHAMINADADIGKNCIINTKALIEHDVQIENHCHISTSAVINGGGVIKEGSFFGSNAVSKEHVKSDKKCFIRAGSVFVCERNDS